LAIATGSFEFQTNKDVNDAFNFVTKDLQPDEKIIIYGYSLGGIGAQELTRKLNELGKKVDLLITVDAVAAWYSDEVNRVIPDNVAKIFNFYQTKEKGVSESRGGHSQSKLCNTPNQLLYNHNLTNQDKTVNHQNIDEKTKKASESLIINEIIREE